MAVVCSSDEISEGICQSKIRVHAYVLLFLFVCACGCAHVFEYAYVYLLLALLCFSLKEKGETELLNVISFCVVSTEIWGRMNQLMNHRMKNKIDFVNKIYYASSRISYYFQGLNKFVAC